ncbi:hypothetical protein A2W14_07510 [Candidatus Gottesmanbacteria bacterium RBG_16_37_8]|uniref:Dockerin domain-containing protein n=1 Tax=Candidatus Gottesmanbacteria bacterium RBG_16_37_8 TaxID=1798371 RepID=A0A1F5YTG4_9BACT|nr:MAG: hypothetical protein A2W14_07510 [Candidatus Gottesmanbacteria bacterium RBG_16_37_8]
MLNIVVSYFILLFSVLLSLNYFLSSVQAQTTCPYQSSGDANCDNKIDGIDYVIWLNHYNRSTVNGGRDGDYNGSGKVDGLDYVVWLNNYSSQPKPTANPNATPTIPGSIPTPQVGELDISICDPSRGPFSLNITNEFYPLPLGKVLVIEDASFKVQFSVLNQTEAVAGVTTRVIEEREWKNGSLIEISRNFFVQAPDGTVCYFGEDVDIYSGGQITGHSGAWRAGVGQNKPGIIMPAHPAVGQKYQQEIAPGIAMDRAEHISMGQSFTTPAGTFNDVLLVEETPPSTKRYQRGIGMIYDDGAVLTSYQ